MSDRATCWSVTINNPLPADDENIALAKQRSGWKVEGQLEQGENGTPHYQLMVKTPQTRFGSIKKAFPRAHIEPARDIKALSNYVTKEDTRIGTLPSNNKYPSLTGLWELFYTYIRTEQLAIPDDEEARLVIFDTFIGLHIELGYHVETMGVNPQMRSAVKKYLPSLMFRAEKIRRQTDRQTDTNNLSDSSIHDEEQSTCETTSTCETESTCETQTSSTSGSTIRLG